MRSAIVTVTQDWPMQQYSTSVGDGGRFEMFVYVEDVDGEVERLRGTASSVLFEPSDMPS
jgi:lactoylglutathione lyase